MADSGNQLIVTSPASASSPYNQGDNCLRPANNGVGGANSELDNH
jgi:hypothetical protein